MNVADLLVDIMTGVPVMKTVRELIPFATKPQSSVMEFVKEAIALSIIDTNIHRCF